jgi:hypothetical protein
MCSGGAVNHVSIGPLLVPTITAVASSDSSSPDHEADAIASRAA